MGNERVDETRERLLAYLLGELPAGELAELDTRLMRDESFAASLEAARDDLLDEYARGDGPRKRHERIERALNLRGGRDESVRFARALGQQLARASQAQPVAQPLAAPRAGLRWALTLTACVGLAVGLWHFHPWRPHARLRPSQASARYTLLLRTDRLRSARAVQVIHLPPAVRWLRVQILLPRGVSGAQVTVHDATGRMREERLAARALSGRPFVQFELPSHRLSPGAYRITVRSLPRGESATERYWFEIASR